MRYYVIDLSTLPKYEQSGKSVEDKPRKHLHRVLKNFELYYVNSGELWLKQGEERCVKQGEIILHAKGEQAGTRLAVSSFFWLHFEGNVEIYDNEEAARLSCAGKEKRIYFAEQFTLCSEDRLTVMLTELNHYFFEKKDGLVKDCLTGALLAELGAQYRQSVSPYTENKRFAEIIGWVSLHISENFSLAALAARFGYNGKYLSFLFRKFTGRTAKEYLTEKRVECAKRHLTGGTNSVKRVAYDVGYEDEYYFMRVFKARTGMTPSDYRKTFSACYYT